MKLSQEQADQVVAYLNLGMKQKDVASKFGCSKPTIWKIARRAGLRKNNTDPLSPEMEKRVIELAVAGRGEPFIARLLAVSPHRVRAVLRRHVLARTGSNEPREGLSELEERTIRSKFRAFEQTMAEEHNVDVSVIQKLLRRRK